MAEISIRFQNKHEIAACGCVTELDVIYDTDGFGLAQAAEKQNAKPLHHFVSMSDEDKAELIEQFDVDPDEIDKPEQWFEPSEGLKTVRSARQHLRESPPNAAAPGYALEWVLRDLVELEKCLLAAQSQQTRFYIAIAP